MTKLTPKQTLAVRANHIQPLLTNPLTIEWFNGGNTVINESTYPGYTPVVVGAISTEQSDENYMSQEQFDALCMDAYYDIDAYVNKAMTVLGMFKEVPNFVTQIPDITIDHMMRAIAAKVEQNIWTRPSNAELKVTLTQNSGGRTTNLPGKENFNPSDLLNEKVKEYINGSMVIEFLEDNFTAVEIDREQFPTWADLAEIIEAGIITIDDILPAGEAGWRPTDDADATDKQYVDEGDEYLQGQINALIVGDIELKTQSIALTNQEGESFTGSAQHQYGVNLENNALLKIQKGRIDDLDDRVGTPLSAIKSTSQEVSNTLATIINYETTDLGTVDNAGTFDVANGTYTVSDITVGDIVSFEAQGKVTGRPQPTFVAGTAYLYKNGELLVDPNTGLPVQTDFTLKTVAGTTFSLKTSNIAIRPLGTEGENEISEGDVISIEIIQSNTNAALGNPLLVSDVQFEMIFKRTASSDIKARAIDDILESIGELIDKNTSELDVAEPTLESLSGTATNQSDVNKEFVLQFNSLVDSIVPIGTVQLGTTAPTFGTWELVGALADGQTIVGGTDTDGEIKSHNHYMFENETISVSSADSITTSTDSVPAASFLITEANSYQMKTNHGEATAGLTSETGATQNKAYGLGLGTINVYRRTA